MSRITEVHVTPFTFTVDGLAVSEQGAMGVSNLRALKGAKFKAMRYAVRIRTDDGLSGGYVTHWVGTQGALGQTLMLAPQLLGRDPEHREGIYDDLKRELRAYDHMGHGALDIALWDLVGHKYKMSIATMLGAYRQKLKVYASTYHGQEEAGGLDTPEAFAAYALACKAKGFAGFKIHGWHNGDVNREADTLRKVRAAVGGRDQMEIMIDPGCELRTQIDALRLGYVCDEVDCMWYEDPYRDASVSVLGAKNLREKLRTPLMITEHVRGPEMKTAYAVAGACDMFHVDPEYDMGITGAMKIAHIAEGLGIDVQYHACGPAHRHCLAATRNSHFYEMALIGPDMPNLIPPVYACGYSDQESSLDADGMVAVPTGPGLGVNYDWDYIERNAIEKHVYKL